VVQKALIFLSLISIAYLGKTQTPDVNLWAGTQVSFKLCDNFKFSQEIGARNKNLLYNQAYLSESQLDYKLASNLKIGLAYRWSIKENHQYTIRKKNRFSLESRWSKKIMKGLRFKCRTKWQHETFNRISSDQVYLSAHTWRNRISFEKKIMKGVKSNLGAEIFFFEKGKPISEFRISNKVSMKIAKRTYLGLGYFFGKEYGTKTNDLNHTFSISMAMELKRKKK
jgi:hypothetical protein